MKSNFFNNKTHIIYFLKHTIYSYPPSPFGAGVRHIVILISAYNKSYLQSTQFYLVMLLVWLFGWVFTIGKGFLVYDISEFYFWMNR
jgi:hypothetical protein